MAPMSIMDHTQHTPAIGGFISEGKTTSPVVFKGAGVTLLKCIISQVYNWEW